MSRDSADAHRTDLQHRNEVLSIANKELRHVNEALVLASGRYLALHDLAPTPFVTIDVTGQIKEVNHAAEALLGAVRNQLLDRSFVSFVDEKMESLIVHQLSTLFSTGALHDLELTIVLDAARIDVLIDAVVLPDQGARRAVLACVDISARKLDEAAKELAFKRAEEASRLQSLGVLAGGIAHDFNNLMTVVLAGADFVLQDLDPASPHVEPLTEVRQAARHAGDLAHQMLAYSGHVSMPAHPIDVVGLVRDLEPLLRASAKSTPVVLELADGVPFVSGDESQLRQVLLNLVVNAGEAMVDRSGVITIAVRADVHAADRRPDPDVLPSGAYVVVEVRDAGIGMDAATKARIFDPYYSTKFAGRGLGMAVVHGVVRGHGGSVYVDSAQGLGTTLRMHLRAVPHHAPPELPPVELAWQGVGTVLVVDDEDVVRATLARAIRKLGPTVVGVASGEEALAIVREAKIHIDVVLTDLTMPGMNGVALAHALRELHPALPIVLITGYGDVKGIGDDLFASRLTKPFETSELRATLQHLLPAVAS